MTKIFDTYCSGAAELEPARLKLEGVLSVQCVLHESDFWGGEYYIARSAEIGKIAIRKNRNRFTGGLNVPEFPDCDIIVSVSAAPDPDIIRSRLLAGGFRLLKRVVR